MVITEKDLFFSSHFFSITVIPKWFEIQKLDRSKMKDNLSHYRWHVSLSVSPSTYPFAGSSAHSLPSHSMIFFGTGNRQQATDCCSNITMSKKTLVPLLQLNFTYMRLEISLGVMYLCPVQTTWDGTMFWYHDSMSWPWTQFLTKQFPNQIFFLWCVYNDSDNS